MAFLSFDEHAGSPVYDFRPFQSTARRMGNIPGDQLSSLLNELFPVGLQPLSLSAEYPWLFAQGLHAEPFVGDEDKITSPATDNLDLSSVNAYDKLKVTISYGTSQPGQSPEGQGDDPVELLEHRWSAGGEFITIPTGGLEWGDGGNVSKDVDAGLLIPHFDMSLRWPRVENPPFATIRDRIGSVNDADMQFKTGVCAPETLMFQGAELSRTVLTTGDLAWDVTYRFGERRVPLGDDTDTVGGDAGGDTIAVGGWNHFYRSELDEEDQEADDLEQEGKTGFFRLKVKSGRDGAGDPIYLLKSLAGLFQEAS